MPLRLDYDFVPSAQEPAEWKEFLRQIWEDDEDSIACLQEWFGYLLTPDTRQQKILDDGGAEAIGAGHDCPGPQGTGRSKQRGQSHAGHAGPAVRPGTADR